MALFKILMSGDNFWLHMDGKPSRIGFCVTRFVRAESAEAAEKAAVQMIRGDQKLRGILNDRSDPPVIHVDEVGEIANDDGEELIQLGFAFYPAKANA